MKCYQHPRCTTCKRALSFLEEKGHNFESVDITQTAPSQEELKQALSHVDSIRKLFNTSGQLYREMKLKEKIADFSEKEALELLSSNGMLVKRPFLITEETTLVGFKKDSWEEAGL